MTREDRKAWEIMSNLFKSIPNVELIPSKKTQMELDAFDVDDECDEEDKTE